MSYKVSQSFKHTLLNYTYAHMWFLHKFQSLLIRNQWSLLRDKDSIFIFPSPISPIFYHIPCYLLGALLVSELLYHSPPCFVGSKWKPLFRINGGIRFGWEPRVSITIVTLNNNSNNVKKCTYFYFYQKYIIWLYWKIFEPTFKLELNIKLYN